MNCVCAVCNVLFRNIDPEKPIVTPCGHLFHEACIERRLQKKSACPQCNHPLMVPQLIRLDLNEPENLTTADEKIYHLQYQLRGAKDKIRLQDDLIESLKGQLQLQIELNSERNKQKADSRQTETSSSSHRPIINATSRRRAGSLNVRPAHLAASASRSSDEPHSDFRPTSQSAITPGNPFAMGYEPPFFGEQRSNEEPGAWGVTSPTTSIPTDNVESPHVTSIIKELRERLGFGPKTTAKAVDDQKSSEDHVACGLSAPTTTVATDDVESSHVSSIIDELMQKFGVGLKATAKAFDDQKLNEDKGACGLSAPTTKLTTDDVSLPPGLKEFTEKFGPTVNIPSDTFTNIKTTKFIYTIPNPSDTTTTVTTTYAFDRSSALSPVKASGTISKSSFNSKSSKKDSNKHRRRSNSSGGFGRREKTKEIASCVTTSASNSSTPTGMFDYTQPLPILSLSNLSLDLAAVSVTSLTSGADEVMRDLKDSPSSPDLPKPGTNTNLPLDFATISVTSLTSGADEVMRDLKDSPSSPDLPKPGTNTNLPLDSTTVGVTSVTSAAEPSEETSSNVDEVMGDVKDSASLPELPPSSPELLPSSPELPKSM